MTALRDGHRLGGREPRKAVLSEDESPWEPRKAVLSEDGSPWEQQKAVFSEDGSPKPVSRGGNPGVSSGHCRGLGDEPAPGHVRLPVMPASLGLRSSLQPARPESRSLCSVFTSPLPPSYKDTRHHTQGSLANPG